MIIALKSKYGFKPDSVKNEWEKVDKTVLRTEDWGKLKVGAVIEVTGRNTRGFITGFKIIDLSGKLVKHNESEVSEGNVHSPRIPSTSSIDSPSASDSFKSDSILKGQSLNLVFNAYFSQNPILIEHKEHRVKAIELSNKLYQEFKASKMEEW